MLHTIWGKVAGVAALGVVSVGGLGAAGALPGLFDVRDNDPPVTDTAVGQSVPEPVQRGQGFAAAMEEWAACVAEAGVAHQGPAEAFDPFAACGEVPHPPDFANGDDESDEVDVPEPAQAGRAFAAAMQEWAACVADAAAGRGDSEEKMGAFDPFAACGELPRPSEFGIGGGPPIGVPTGLPEGVPTGPPAGVATGGPAGVPEGVATGAPAGVPTGAPGGVPTGAPTEVPSGRPAGAPTGPPSGAPSGPPEGVPAGPPSGAPEGRP
jgi:hypothetical protein